MLLTVLSSISDHASLLCKLCPEKPPTLVKVVSYRKYKLIDTESFENDLASSVLCQDHTSSLAETSTDDVDKLVADYNNTLSALIDKYAPLKSKTVNTRPSVPWYTAEICAAKRLRRKAKRKWSIFLYYLLHFLLLHTFFEVNKIRKKWRRARYR